MDDAGPAKQGGTAEAEPFVPDRAEGSLLFLAHGRTTWFWKAGRRDVRIHLRETTDEAADGWLR
ncbi:MAG TPA: hypothetical protein DEU95_13075 [Chloroflexi bacterium]|jgi:hypothetical protein|nr:hypothetical protein [Chloroflexota bacterium]HCG30618.1 hypothetical protein [Chloroflexota bacterium]